DSRKARKVSVLDGLNGTQPVFFRGPPVEDCLRAIFPLRGPAFDFLLLLGAEATGSLTTRGFLPPRSVAPERFFFACLAPLAPRICRSNLLITRSMEVYMSSLASEASCRTLPLAIRVSATCSRLFNDSVTLAV